jgi:hypothetical protein
MSNQYPENYIYITHLGETGHWWWLPCCPETISDSMSSNFSETTALGRSAPVFTYSSSGPRTVQVDLHLHRDIMDELNKSNAWPEATDFPTSFQVENGEDYTDSLIRALQAISVPKYAVSEKLVEPPLVMMRLSNEVFIKGIVNGNIGLEYQLPIITGGRYAQVRLSITITEVDPYDATTIFKNGSFRGVVQTLKDKVGLSQGE